MTLRCSGVVSVAMIGPRVAGSGAPQWIGVGLVPPAPGCEFSLMCLELCLLAIAQVILCGKRSRVTRRSVGVKEVVIAGRAASQLAEPHGALHDARRGQVGVAER